MAGNLVTIKVDGLKAIGDGVLVSEMNFGEQKTKSGLIIRADDGEVRGIYARWGRVISKGPKNTDPYEVGQWILVDHGRWTRGVNISINGEDLTVRKVNFPKSQIQI
jgi:co-chaperonin GroES (HSP10)